MHGEPTLKDIQGEYSGSLRAYLIGFVLSLLLTSLSFLLVLSKALTGRTLIFAIVGLALAQAIVQLLFFLHLGHETKTHWETAAFYFMVAILLIISLGSLWIMYNLNDRMMSDMAGM